MFHPSQRVGFDLGLGDDYAVVIADGQERRLDSLRGFSDWGRYPRPSMGEIARKARVSKGTLYVYFDSKERLFEAIAHEECGAQAETVFSLDPADCDVEGVLTRVGCSFVKFLCRPGAMSPLRTVIAISDRMPEIGREFYETGPAEGVTKLCHYLESQVAAGF